MSEQHLTRAQAQCFLDAIKSLQRLGTLPHWVELSVMTTSYTLKNAIQWGGWYLCTGLNNELCIEMRSEKSYPGRSILGCEPDLERDRR